MGTEMYFKVEAGVACSSVDKAPRWSGEPETYRISKFVVGSCRLDAVFLIEGSVLYPCYEIWEQLR